MNFGQQYKVLLITIILLNYVNICPLYVVNSLHGNAFLFCFCFCFIYWFIEFVNVNRYEAVPYLTKETNHAVLVTRLKLIESLSLVLKKGLSLLGIPTLERI